MYSQGSPIHNSGDPTDSEGWHPQTQIKYKGDMGYAQFNDYLSFSLE